MKLVLELPNTKKHGVSFQGMTQVLLLFWAAVMLVFSHSSARRGGNYKADLIEAINLADMVNLA